MAEAGRTVPGAGRHATVPLLGRIAVACYPPWWRARYGDGQLGFLADLHAEGRSGARALPNLMAGAVWTRLSGTGMPPTPSAWRNRARTSVTASALAAMPLMMLGLYASHRGGYWSGNGRLSTAGRVAEDAGNFAFFALALVLLMLASGGASSSARRTSCDRGRRGDDTSPPWPHLSSPSLPDWGCGPSPPTSARAG